MKKDDFWSVDKLLPPIRLSTDFSHKNGAVPISSLEDSLPLKNWGERITVPNSRVILSYRLTEPIFTQDVALGEDFGYPENDRPPFVSCTFYSPSLRMLTAEMRRYFVYFYRCVQKRKKSANLLRLSFACPLPYDTGNHDQEKNSRGILLDVGKLPR